MISKNNSLTWRYVIWFLMCFLQYLYKPQLFTFGWIGSMEQVAIAATSAMSATLLTNPLEVVKTRFQLQGELKAKGHYAVHYKGFFHAMYVIARTDGFVALQAGLVPALWHQLFMNGIRLSCYQVAQERGWTVNENGHVSLGKSAAVAAVLGAFTAYTGSPFYLVKIRLQSQSSKSIAVGTQHNFEGTFQALSSIFRSQGIKGLWQGCLGSVPRRMVGSSTQLVSFTYSKQLLADNTICTIEPGYLNSFLASMLAGVMVTIAMNPLDIISTRLYNQGVDSQGRGKLYSSYFDCVRKMFKTEGFTGFYKGVTPMFIRTGPHNLLVLFIWDRIRQLHSTIKESSS